MIFCKGDRVKVKQEWIRNLTNQIVDQDKVAPAHKVGLNQEQLRKQVEFFLNCEGKIIKAERDPTTSFDGVGIFPGGQQVVQIWFVGETGTPLASFAIDSTCLRKA